MSTDMIGLNAEKSQRVIDRLMTLLSDSQIHYQNLRGYHWNVRGAGFFTLHALFEKYYDEYAGRIDEIAERILTLGGKPLHTFQDYMERSTIPVRIGENLSWDIVATVTQDTLSLIKSQREIIIIASENEDEVTADMLIGYNASDEKKIWMLSAYMDADKHTGKK